MAVAVFLIAGCATTSTTARKDQPSTSRVAVEDNVGFTIVEEAEVGTVVRDNYTQAMTYLDRSDDATGISLLEDVASAAPELSAPQVELGIAQHRAGNLDKAEEHLLRALELNPEHPIAHNELGIVYRKQGRFDEARKAYEAALDVYPGFHHALRNLAILCDLYLLDLQCALGNYEAYMETVPEDDEAEMWIADLRLRMGD